MRPAGDQTMKALAGLICLGALVLGIGLADLIINILQPPKDLSQFKRDPSVDTPAVRLTSKQE